jgi:hypothetical protein
MKSTGPQLDQEQQAGLELSKPIYHVMLADAS